MMAEKLRPGDEVKVAGQYIIVDDEGQRVPNTAEYTLAAGDIAPPTPGKGMFFLLVDASERAGGPQTEKRRGFGEKPRRLETKAVPQPERAFVPQPEAGEK